MRQSFSEEIAHIRRLIRADDNVSIASHVKARKRAMKATEFLRTIFRSAVTAILLALSTSGATTASPLSGSTNGCGMLGDAVEQAVLTAASQGGWQARNNILTAALSAGGTAYAPVACASTTETVSAGFHAGLRRVAINIGWNAATHPIDHCLSHDLRQCYPTGHVSDFGSHANLRFVLDGWAAIRTGVIGSMPGGPASNHSTFSAHSIAGSLAASLSTHMSGSLAGYHQSISDGSGLQ